MMIRYDKNREESMRLYEDTHTEFKSIYTDDIKKTVVAFANTGGGHRQRFGGCYT